MVENLLIFAVRLNPMEQKDYILREIAKIGTLIMALRRKLFGGGNTTATLEDDHLEEAKEMLLQEGNFDLDLFLSMGQQDSESYLDSILGFSVENIELLAEWFYQLGVADASEQSNKFLEKALELYELCNLKSRTFSMNRETMITTIKNTLKH